MTLTVLARLSGILGVAFLSLDEIEIAKPIQVFFDDFIIFYLRIENKMMKTARAVRNHDDVGAYRSETPWCSPWVVFTILYIYIGWCSPWVVFTSVVAGEILILKPGMCTSSDTTSTSATSGDHIPYHIPCGILDLEGCRCR